MEHNDPMFQLGVLLADFILSQYGTDIGSHQVTSPPHARSRDLNSIHSRKPDAAGIPS